MLCTAGRTSLISEMLCTAGRTSLIREMLCTAGRTSLIREMLCTAGLLHIVYSSFMPVLLTVYQLDSDPHDNYKQQCSTCLCSKERQAASMEPLIAL